MNVNSIDFPIDMQAQGNEIIPKLDAMRDADPIYYSEANHAWIVTGHKEVSQGFSGKLPLSSVRLPHHAIHHISHEDREKHLPYFMHAPQSWVLNVDGEQHARIRRLISRAFAKPVVDAIRPDVRRHVRALLDAVPLDEPFEFYKRVALPIPAHMILKQFGLDDNLVDKINYWARCMALIGNVNVPLDDLVEAEAAFRDMTEVFKAALDERRLRPTEDFMSMLLQPLPDGEQLTEDEMIGACMITVVAGHDTTANTMTLAIAEMARNPAFSAALRNAPSIDLNAIMEIQRRVQMSFMQSRVVAQDFDWNGRQLKAGEFVLLMIGAANRDPAVFSDPYAVDLKRNPSYNLAFAPGLHHCIGHLIAKMILGEFFNEFLPRFDVEPVEDELHWSAGVGFRGLERLMVRLVPR